MDEVTTNLSVEDVKKQAARDRMAKARANRGKKKPESTEVAALKAKIAELEAQRQVIAEKSDNIAPALKVKGDGDIQWFTEVDLNSKGKIANDYPSWYYDINIKELAEDIRVIEKNLTLDVYSGQRKLDALKQLDERKTRYSKIVDGKPKLDGAKKDKVSRSFNELGERIKESMFSYDESWKQTADAHAEAERMVMPTIDVGRDDVVGSFIREKGIKVDGGKISRNDASVIWKVLAKALGEQTDVERLRRIK